MTVWNYQWKLSDIWLKNQQYSENWFSLVRLVRFFIGCHLSPIFTKGKIQKCAQPVDGFFSQLAVNFLDTTSVLWKWKRPWNFWFVLQQLGAHGNTQKYWGCYSESPISAVPWGKDESAIIETALIELSNKTNKIAEKFAQNLDFNRFPKLHYTEIRTNRGLPALGCIFSHSWKRFAP